MKRSDKQRLVAEIMEHCVVDKPRSFVLKDHKTDWVGPGEIIQLSGKKLKKEAKKIMTENLEELSEAQELLYATGKYSMLLIFQAMDAAG